MIATARQALAELLTPALAGAPLSWTTLPQDCPTPAARLTLISDQRGASHAGVDGLSEATVQLDIFGDDAEQCQALRDAALAAAHGHKGGSFGYILHDASRDDVDADGTYSASCDFRLVYSIS
jgi:hypothetical protein